MKKIIRLLKRRRAGGFTLVEMVVSVALVAILLGGMMLFVSPIVRSFNDTKTDLVAENVSVCLQEYITKNVRLANQVAIFSNTNSSALTTNDAYKTRIQELVKNCGSSGVKTFTLNCISLKYSDGRYYLYEESLDSSGNILGSGKKVFSDGLYSSVYPTFEFRLPLNQDYGKTPEAGRYRDDAVQYTVRTYGDSSYSDLLFQGDGYFELRQIRVGLEDEKYSAGAKQIYNMSIMPDTPLSFGEMTEGSRDIFIFYVSRNVNAATTTT